MPVYCYTDPDTKHTVEVFRTLAERRPPFIMRDGHKYYRDVVKEHSGNSPRRCRTYPRFSEAAGTNPEQIAEAMETDKTLGVGGTMYDPRTGAVRFESPQHEKKYAEAYGMFHRNSYGGKNFARRASDRSGGDPSIQQIAEAAQDEGDNDL